MTPERVAAGDSIAHIARVLGVGASSVSRALSKADEDAVVETERGATTAAQH